MKTVCVITFFQSQDNYGQLLQCYALQKILKKLGFSPKVIRYGFHEKYFHWYRKENFTTISGLKNLLKRCLLKKAKNCQIDRGFNSFRSKHIKQTRRSYNNLTELRINPPKADCYITGSDQVWAQLLSISDNRSFFLDFGKSDVRRIAYAPSFAVNEYPNNIKQNLQYQLSHFDAISVREKSGVNICKSVGYKVKLVLDPTLLLEANDYNRILKETTDDNYCFIYHVNIDNASDIYWQHFKDYNIINNIKNYATYANPISGIKMEMIEGAKYVYPSIPEWIGWIKNARYILTSSFHGVVFSIIYHIPFVVCLRKESMFAGNDRIITLLDSLDLEDRIFTPNMDVALLLSKVIKWDEVCLKLNTLKKESLSFISDNL